MTRLALNAIARHAAHASESLLRILFATVALAGPVVSEWFEPLVLWALDAMLSFRIGVNQREVVVVNIAFIANACLRVRLLPPEQALATAINVVGFTL
jgi:hypothetical protein